MSELRRVPDPMLAACDHHDPIPWDALPKRFVISVPSLLVQHHRDGQGTCRGDIRKLDAGGSELVLAQPRMAR
jgi:hypothetical protein